MDDGLQRVCAGTIQGRIFAEQLGGNVRDPAVAFGNGVPLVQRADRRNATGARGEDGRGTKGAGLWGRGSQPECDHSQRRGCGTCGQRFSVRLSRPAYGERRCGLSTPSFPSEHRAERNSAQSPERPWAAKAVVAVDQPVPFRPLRGTASSLRLPSGKSPTVSWTSAICRRVRRRPEKAVDLRSVIRWSMGRSRKSGERL